ncbi:hypothetical protein GQ457_10G000930 [Hibiscus cannabinus]
MLNRLVGKPQQEANTLTTLDKLNETLEMLEKKEKVLLKKAATEVEKAKEFTRARNKKGAKATTETVDALRTGAAAMKAMQKATNIDDVDKTMDVIDEQTENMKQIQEELSTPIGAAADFDEDELEVELEELEGAELKNNFSSQQQRLLLHRCRCLPAGNQLVLFLRSARLRKTNSLLCRLRWHFNN